MNNKTSRHQHQNAVSFWKELAVSFSRICSLILQDLVSQMITVYWPSFKAFSLNLIEVKKKLKSQEWFWDPQLNICYFFSSLYLTDWSTDVPLLTDSLPPWHNSPYCLYHLMCISKNQIYQHISKIYLFFYKNRT